MGQNNPLVASRQVPPGLPVVSSGCPLGWPRDWSLATGDVLGGWEAKCKAQGDQTAAHFLVALMPAISPHPPKGGKVKGWGLRGDGWRSGGGGHPWDARMGKWGPIREDVVV